MGLVGTLTTLWLVRHGLTEWSSAGRLTGWTDVPLSEQGRAQALALRDQLAGREFAGVWSSDLRRASETAEVAVGGGVADARLRELDFGSLEGSTWADCDGDVRAALTGFDSFIAPGGESVVRLRERLDSFIAELPSGDHLVFTHGGVIRALLRARGDDRVVECCEIVRLDLTPRSHGDRAHNGVRKPAG